jgi:hypothetical protein
MPLFGASFMHGRHTARASRDGTGVTVLPTGTPFFSQKVIKVRGTP